MSLDLNLLTFYLLTVLLCMSVLPACLCVCAVTPEACIILISYGEKCILGMILYTVLMFLGVKSFNLKASTAIWYVDGIRPVSIHSQLSCC